MKTADKNAAREYAMQNTLTRCAYMGTNLCFNCTRADRGYCDFRARYNAFLAGRKTQQESMRKTIKYPGIKIRLHE